MFINTGLYSFAINNLDVTTKEKLAAAYNGAVDKKSAIIDYEINIAKSGLIRRIFKPQCSIEIEGQQPFNPVEPQKLLPSIEWAMNWCIAAYAHNHLLFHASVVEKNNLSIIFPAHSGSGKSTLSTYLSLNGWHLFYDEMAVINIDNSYVNPVYRPSSLKNESIDIIKQENGLYHLTEVTHNTHKGSIAHAMPHSKNQFDSFTPAPCVAVVFLNYQANRTTEIYELEKSVGFSSMLLNAFNYTVIGKPAFHALTNLANKARFFEVTYSNMSEVNEFLSDFIDSENIC